MLKEQQPKWIILDSKAMEKPLEITSSEKMKRKWMEMNENMKPNKHLMRSVDGSVFPSGPLAG